MLGFPMNFSQQPYFDQWDYLNLVELVFGRIQLGKVCVSPKSVPHVPFYQKSILIKLKLRHIFKGGEEGPVTSTFSNTSIF